VNHSEIVSFLWGVADLIRDTFRRSKYQDVILPLTVLRRLDCVLANTKERVLKRQAELKGKGLGDLDAQLRRASGFAFYNTSRYDFDKLLADAPEYVQRQIKRTWSAGTQPNISMGGSRADFRRSPTHRRAGQDRLLRGSRSQKSRPIGLKSSRRDRAPKRVPHRPHLRRSDRQDPRAGCLCVSRTAAARSGRAGWARGRTGAD
jgi:hypothetical protein